PEVGQVCDDGNACTAGDQCIPVLGGVRCEGKPINCNDGNPCTTDSCDPATGKGVSTPSCDDGNPCTIDTCEPATGQCLNTPIDCDDGNVCTKDFCDPNGQCQHQPEVGQTCDDGNACTTFDQCVPTVGGGAACQGKPINCDDGNPCTLDRCDPA